MTSIRADQATLAIADTSVFMSFAEAGALLHLPPYFGRALRISEGVQEELRRNATRREFEALKTLERIRPFRDLEALSLPPELAKLAARRLQLSQKPGDHEKKNWGEVESMLIARYMRDEQNEQGLVVLVDDKDPGVAMANEFELRRLSTAQLAAEMVTTEKIDHETGWRIFDFASGPDAGRRAFERALGEVPRIE